MIVTIFILCIIFSSCQGEKPAVVKNNINETIDTMTFSQYILAIDKIESNAVAIYQVTENKYFRFVANNALMYKKDAIGLLGNNDYNLQHKLIAIYSMQNLPFEDYLDFMRITVDLFVSGKINERLMLEIISCQYSTNYQVIKNYQEIEIIKILNVIKKNNSTSENLKEYIDKILSGKIWNNLSNNR